MFAITLSDEPNASYCREAVRGQVTAQNQNTAERGRLVFCITIAGEATTFP
jgi:hypothetical protein